MENVVIIGSGCAGWTAALYTARANLAPLVLTGAQPGGLLTTTSVVENYPGFPHGVTGPEMMQLFKEQALRFGTRIESLTVTAVDVSKRPFVVTAGGRTWATKSVIIATGANAKYLGLPSEEHFKNRGVSACATCDGFFFRGKRVAVIGGGNSAVEEALYLTHHASQSPWCIGATPCAPRRSCRSGCSGTRRSRLSGTPSWRRFSARTIPAA